MPENAPRQATGQTCLIVGAGIIGACMAYRLVRTGLKVTLVDSVGPHAGASGKSWAWINAVAADTSSYVALRRAGIDAYHRLEQELAGKLEIDWTGSLIWDSALFDPQGDYSDRQGIRRVDAQEIQTLEPLLNDPPVAALYSAEDGLVDGAHAAETVLNAANTAGMRAIYGFHAETLISDGRRVRGVAGGGAELRADITVLCSGTGTSGLLSTLGLNLPTRDRPGLLVTTQPVGARLSRAIWTEKTHVKQLRDGRLLIGESAHDEGALTDPETLADAMLRDTERLLPGCGPLRLERYTIATRPIPGDGYPAIGPIDHFEGLYVAMMHSGMTLAAITGELAAREISGDAPQELLAAFRPGRFPGMIRKD